MEIWSILGGLGFGTVMTAIITRYLDKNKTTAEIDSLAVQTADQLVDRVRKELDFMQREINALREDRTQDQRYITYLLSRLEKHGIKVVSYDDWKVNNNG